MKDLIRLSGKANRIHDEIQSYGTRIVFARKRPISPTELREFSGALMIAIPEVCFRDGAKEIGHIKAHLEYETGFLTADTLGLPLDVRVEGRDGEPTGRFTLTINSVVYGLSREAVSSATQEVMSSVSLRFGLRKGEADIKRTGKEKI